MSNTLKKSVDALAQAILYELVRAEEDDSKHSTIQISFVEKALQNGLNQCSVQIECAAGCGWLVEDVGTEADELAQKAIAIRGMLCSSAGTSLSEILSTVFSESLTEVNLMHQRSYMLNKPNFLNPS